MGTMRQSPDYTCSTAAKVAATCAALSLSAVAIILPSNVLAQSAPVERVTAAPVCMARASTDGSRLSIILPAANATVMQAKGFAPLLCHDVFASQADIAAYRDGICGIASSWREELQDHFENVHGERPAVLCALAEAASGRWKRKGEN